MKLTNKYLKKLITEEVTNFFSEQAGGYYSSDLGQPGDSLKVDPYAATGGTSVEAPAAEEPAAEEPAEKPKFVPAKGWKEYVAKTMAKNPNAKAEELMVKWHEVAEGLGYNKDFYSWVKWYNTTRKDAEAMAAIGKKAGSHMNTSQVLGLLSTSSKPEPSKSDFAGIEKRKQRRAVRQQQRQQQRTARRQKRKEETPTSDFAGIQRRRARRQGR